MSVDYNDTAEFICKCVSPHMLYYHSAMIVQLINEDVAGDPSLIASKAPAIGDEVTLSPTFVNVQESGLVRGVKLTTTSGHDIGWIRKYDKQDLLTLIGTAKNVKGTVIRRGPYFLIME